MTQVVSVRLKADQVERLKRFARRLGKSQSEMGAQLIEEALRENEFACIEFRDSVIGRQAYMKGSNLAVWEVIMVAQDHSMDLECLADYFRRPVSWVKAALHYYEAFHAEIEPILDDNRGMTYDRLKRLLPELETRSESLLAREGEQEG